MTRSTFAGAAGLMIRLLIVFCFMLMFMKMSGGILFVPWVTDLLVDAADQLGIYGDEAVVDLYIDVTATASLITAVVIVVLGHRWWKSRTRMGLPGSSTIDRDAARRRRAAKEDEA